MQLQVLEVVATRDEFDSAQDAGRPRPLALTYHDQLTGPSGEYLVLLYRWDKQSGSQWTMYSGSQSLMGRSKLCLEGSWDEDDVLMEFKDSDGSIVDSLYFDLRDKLLTLEVPGINGTEWRRVNPDDYVFEIDDQNGILKLSKR